MPIEMHLGIYHHQGEPDLHEPHIICDVCDERIQQFGNVLFRPPQEGRPSGLVFAHKGICTRYYEKINGQHYWQELGEFFAYLIRGSGVPPERIKPVLL